MSDNPYEPPRVESINPFQEPTADPRELERRITLLEQTISQSWFLSSNITWRIFAVIGHFVIGYAAAAAIFFSLVWLATWLRFFPIRF